MPTLADYIALRTRKPTATVRLNGQICRAVLSLRTSQAFGSGISTATVVLRDPPTTPQIGMSITWTWGYNGRETAGFTGEISQPARKSYPNRYTLQCRDVLWRADRSKQVIQTDPLNDITASAAIRYILTHYGGISSSRISLPTFSASGSAWVGSEWTLGTLTPVQWGDPDNESGGTSALKAAQEICSVLGYWLYADASGIIRAKQMDRAPSLSAAWTFRRGVDLLTDGSPELSEDVDALRTRIIVLGGNTGVDGAQITDVYQTSHPLLPSGVYQEDTFSSFLIEYENATDAGAASATEVAKRILKVRSRPPIIVRHRVKANPMLSVGATVGIVDSGIGYTTAKNFFIYELETSLDCATGNFSQQMTLDGGTGNSGYSTIPPPDASFSWRLVAETVDGDAIVEVFLDGSGSTSLTGGVIVDWDWSTGTSVYSGTSNSATGEHAVLFFLASEGTADITLTVTDTTSKTGSITQTIDLTGADTFPPFREALHGAAGAAWYATPDGGATWNTSTGDAIAVDIVGAGADDRSAGTAGTYGIVTTRGSGGSAGLRQSVDLLASTPTSLVSNSAALTSNIWRNESNPARLWFAVGSTVYRSIDGGVTKTAMAAAPASVTWIMEDAAVENSIFLLAGASMYNATAPDIGYALLYEGPVGSTARQFVRSRDGGVTWIAFTDAPAGESLQRVETGALADWAATDCRTLALDNAASSLSATLYAITGDDPAQIWTFDGLTGLDAVQSSQTFPSGATVQHMIGSRHADLFYTADFDSIASGQGAFRKYVATADLLLLWKGLAAGEQGHMLGLAARASAPAEFLRMSNAVDPAQVWHYRDGVWAARPLPVSGTTQGITIAADPFNADRWLAVFNNNANDCFASGGKIVGNAWAYSPLWVTEDAGLTWNEVIITPPGGWVDGSILINVAWSDQAGNRWGAAFASGDTFYTALVTGTSSTVLAILETTAYSAPLITAGVENEWLLAATFTPGFEQDMIAYVDTAYHTPTGSLPGDLTGTIERAPGVSRIAYVTDEAHDILATADYRSAQPTTFIPGQDVGGVARSGVALYYQQRIGRLVRVIDPEGAGTSTTLVDANIVTYPKVDRQTRTIGAAAGDGFVISDDGTTTHRIAGPADEGLLAGNGSGNPYAFDVIVRA